MVHFLYLQMMYEKCWATTGGTVHLQYLRMVYVKHCSTSTFSVPANGVDEALQMKAAQYIQYLRMV
jgi:hypothetical protein